MNDLRRIRSESELGIQKLYQYQEDMDRAFFTDSAVPESLDANRLDDIARDIEAALGKSRLWSLHNQSGIFLRPPVSWNEQNFEPPPNQDQVLPAKSQGADLHEKNRQLYVREYLRAMTFDESLAELRSEIEDWAKIIEECPRAD